MMHIQRYCYVGFLKAGLNGTITINSDDQSRSWDSFWEYVDRTLNRIRNDANHSPVEILQYVVQVSSSLDDVHVST